MGFRRLISSCTKVFPQGTAVADRAVARQDGGKAAGRLLCGYLLLASLSFGGVEAAELLTTAESAALLKRIGIAARSLNYSGVYQYLQAENLENFRLIHAFDGGGEHERRESLDGAAREYVRHNEHIIAYIPGERAFTLDRRTANKFFPGVMPDQAVDVLSNYSFKRMGQERVAGYDCMLIVLEPRDKLRNPHKICIELESGLMIKSAMFGPKHGELIEQFTFSQLEIGEDIDKRQLVSKLASKALPGEAVSSEMRQAIRAGQSSDLYASNLPSGFKLIKQTRSRMPGKREPVQHFLFSDGLATVSVFIEPASNAPVAMPPSLGTLSFFSRQFDGWRVTVLGEVPLRTVQLFAQAYALRE